MILISACLLALEAWEARDQLIFETLNNYITSLGLLHILIFPILTI